MRQGEAAEGEALIELLEAGRTGDALARMLVQWREDPDPVLASQIDRLSATIADVLTPPTHHWTWITRCAMCHPSDLNVLMESAIRSHKRHTALQLERLLEWPRDPRFFAWFPWCRAAMSRSSWFVREDVLHTTMPCAS